MDLKTKCCVCAVVLFFVVGNPEIYKLVNGVTSVMGLNVSNEVGCPTQTGVVVHTVVFTLLLCLCCKMM